MKTVKQFLPAIYIGLFVVAAAIVAGTTFVNYYLIMPGKSFAGPVPPLSAEEQRMSVDLEKYVRHLAVTIGERNLHHPAQLAAASEFIRSQLQSYGWNVETQSFQQNGMQFENLIVERRGETKPDEIVVIGAHYDSAPNCPAANDNGTGVAALLCLARQFKSQTSPRTLRFVAFTNEEPPFFGGKGMGSYQYAQSCKAGKENIVAMLSLETLGYYCDKPGTQLYPPGLNLLYPDRGNFIGFVGTLSAAPLVRDCVKYYRDLKNFPCEGGSAPAWIEGVDWSDHKNFSSLGYPALMVTDTAVFRYPYYHTSQDTPEHVNFGKLARVTTDLAKLISHLTSR